MRFQKILEEFQLSEEYNLDCLIIIRLIKKLMRH